MLNLAEKLVDLKINKLNANKFSKRRIFAQFFQTYYKLKKS